MLSEDLPNHYSFDSDTEFSDLSNISPEKLQLLRNVLSAILALPIARDTYAQIIEGRPTQPSFKKNYHAMLEYSTVSEATEPSSEAIRHFEDVRRSFTPAVLAVNLQTAQSFPNTVVGTREHDLGLLEIVAASLNALAGMLYSSFHPETDIRPQKPPGLDLTFYQSSHFYVDFYHSCFMDINRYPRGLLDVAGYWAELQILGGVLLFDRGDDGADNLDAFVEKQHVPWGYQLSQQHLEKFSSLANLPHSDAVSTATDLLPFQLADDCCKVPMSKRVGQPPLRVWKNLYDKPRLLPPSMNQCLPPASVKALGLSSRPDMHAPMREKGAAVGQELGVLLSEKEKELAASRLSVLAAEKGWLRDEEMKGKLQKIVDRKRTPEGDQRFEHATKLLEDNGILPGLTREGL